MRVVAIIQARMRSTRLPGKILQELDGRTVLSHVIDRARNIPGVAAVCCAVPEDAEDEPVAEEARRQGAVVHRGPERDVLTRYQGAARASRAEAVMRITSDCPFIDPGVSGRVLAEFLRTDADYCSNLEPRSWPKGLDTEIFKTDVLETAAASARDPADREHVTPWIRRNRALRHASVVKPGQNCADYRWTLDYPQDLAFFRAVAAQLPATSSIVLFDDILAVVHAHPEIVALNAGLQ